MKKLQQLLEEMELKAALGVSLKLGVSGFEATLLEGDAGQEALPAQGLAQLPESRLDRDNLMLVGKLAYRRLADRPPEDAHEREAELARYRQEGIELKRAAGALLPVPGAYAKAMLQIKSDAVVKEPIVILMNSSLKGELHLHLSVRRGARAKVVLISQLDVVSAQCLRLTQEEHSRLELVWLPLQTTRDSMLAMHAALGEGAQLNLYQPCLDGEVVFSNRIELLGDRARVETVASAFGEGRERKRVETSICHRGGKGYSRIRKRGVLADEAEIAFYGRQIIDKRATDTDSYQESRFLVLNEGVKAISHPVMVIDENELQAGHAASVGAADPEQLFYLQSRGLTREQSERLMTQAFLRPGLEEIFSGAVATYLLNRLTTKVDKG